jgi:hypothetical protein
VERVLRQPRALQPVAGGGYDQPCARSSVASIPDEPFEEIGTMKHYNRDVREVGGHAVIAPRTNQGRYEAATVIGDSKGFHP